MLMHTLAKFEPVQQKYEPQGKPWTLIPLNGGGFQPTENELPWGKPPFD